jgi:hypothetical protein
MVDDGMRVCGCGGLMNSEIRRLLECEYNSRSKDKEAPGFYL